MLHRYLHVYSLTQVYITGKECQKCIAMHVPQTDTHTCILGLHSDICCTCLPIQGLVLNIILIEELMKLVIAADVMNAM